MCRLVGLLVLIPTIASASSIVWTCEGHCWQEDGAYWVTTENGIPMDGAGIGDETVGSQLTFSLLGNVPIYFHYTTEESGEDFDVDYPWLAVVGGSSWPLYVQPWMMGRWIGPIGLGLERIVGPYLFEVGVVHRFDTLYDSTFGVRFTAPDTSAPVPEPGTLLLVGGGLVAAWRRLRRPAE
jgi:hypothetical protein